MAGFLIFLVHFLCCRTLLVNGQCTVWTYTGSESDEEDFKRSLEEHDLKLRILGEQLNSTFGNLEVNVKRTIVMGLEEHDENLKAALKNSSSAFENGDKKLLQELEKHTQNMKDIYHNTSIKIEKKFERIQDNECLRVEENKQFLLGMFLNWSSKVEKIDGSIKDVNKTLERKLEEPNQRLISLYQNLSARLDNIDTKFDFMQNAISEKVEEHEKNLELIDQNLSPKFKSTNESLLRVLDNDGNIQQMYERLSSRLQALNESIVRSSRDNELKLQTIHENFTAVIDEVNEKLNAVLYLANETIQYVKSKGDALSWHNGRQFSTKDQDNDDYRKNCSNTERGAWWYGHCHHSNLNGIYYPGGSKRTGASSDDGIVWYHWLGSSYPLKTTEMMMAPY